MLLETSCGHLRAFVTDPRSIKAHSLMSTANNMLTDWSVEWILQFKFFRKLEEFSHFMGLLSSRKIIFQERLNVKRWSDRKNERILQIKLSYWEFLALSQHMQNNNRNSLMVNTIIGNLAAG